MDFIFDAINEWIKKFLIEAIQGNLSGMFDGVTPALRDRGRSRKTPEAWNSGVFSIIRSLSQTAVLPIAGLVIAAILSYELISMIIDKNNMHDIDTWMFVKWVFKAGIAIFVINHTFDFIMAIFDVTQNMVQKATGVIDAQASIDITAALASITTELEAMGTGELFGS